MYSGQNVLEYVQIVLAQYLLDFEIYNLLWDKNLCKVFRRVRGLQRNSFYKGSASKSKY